MCVICRLSETKILRPDHEDQGSTLGVRLLSPNEHGIFNRLCRMMMIAQKLGRLAFVYRGERKSTLSKKLSAKPDTHMFLDRLFFVGDKAKHYFRQSNQSLKNRDYLRSIDDCSVETFEYIFRVLHRIVTQGPDAGKPGKSRKVEQFKKRNPEIVKFFGKESNLTKFIDNIYKLTPEHKREEVRDYYLYLLHTDGPGQSPYKGLPVITLQVVA
jgi:phage terminase small subunit